MGPLKRLHLLLAAHAVLLIAASGVLGDNFAVIVSSSRYWHNYRHTANALAVYAEVKRLGIPDTNIVLMLADPVAFNPRNLLPGTVYLDPSPAQRGNLYTPDVQVDYQGREVNVESLLGVLTGRHPAAAPLSRRLRSGPNSSVLLYLTGHGGDEFLKFHDQEELLAADLGGAITQMHLAGRYSQLLVMLDTCQAATMFNRISAPNVVGLATSKLGESSYAHWVDLDLGVHLADQFTFHMAAFLQRLRPNSPATLAQLADYARQQGISSTLVPWASETGGRPLDQVRVMDFFSGGGPSAEGHTPPDAQDSDTARGGSGTWWAQASVAPTGAAEAKMDEEGAEGGEESKAGGASGHPAGAAQQDRKRERSVEDGGGAHGQEPGKGERSCGVGCQDHEEVSPGSLYPLLLDAPLL